MIFTEKDNESHKIIENWLVFLTYKANYGTVLDPGMGTSPDRSHEEEEEEETGIGNRVGFNTNLIDFGLKGQLFLCGYGKKNGQ